MNILIVEDQRRLAEALAAILTEAGYHVDTVFDGRDGLDYALMGSYDAIVLDVMLPKLDGFEVIRELRKSSGESHDVPVIMLTARDTLRDKITGLDAGADDYLTKPFQPAELLARIRALTRRKATLIIDTITVGNTTLDLQLATLEVDEKKESNGDTKAGESARLTVNLSHREFEVCRLLMSNARQTISKAKLLTAVWGMATDADENSVEAYISFLRKKLRYIGSNLQIQTHRMMGYRLVVAETPTLEDLHDEDIDEGIDTEIAAGKCVNAEDVSSNNPNDNNPSDNNPNDNNPSKDPAC